MFYNFAEHEVFTFSDHTLIPEVIQNWIVEQPEYPKTGPELGSMSRLDLDKINTMVNNRYRKSLEK